MKSSRLHAVAAATALAIAVLAGAHPAAAASPVIQFTHLSIDTEHVDVTGGPADATVSLTLTDTNPAAVEVMGWVELRQFAGGTEVGAPLRLRIFDPLLDTAPGVRTATIALSFPVPRYGTAPEAVWRVTRVDVLDGQIERTLRGDALAAFGAEFGVTQLVETDAPRLDDVTLGENQSPYVVDPGTGVRVDYRVTATDLPSGLWKGRLVLAGPGGARLTTPFAAVWDGRHLTCGSNLIDGIYDHVECRVDVAIPAGTPAGTWTVARVTLTDRLGTSATITRPDGPTVYVTRS
ncbi:hypothetical protein [Jidongwangia harbinensis]|uniref:hypothetical protein n=1 Tax=Jidongwangia harbinensis TaxID=2878561 RepID=UPI001CD93729|nr:hypothetical protein [Jidongwangia harbinensis]MCA2215833.1 hypothetical protein [Jidongwangia harbinensis]